MNVFIIDDEVSICSSLQWLFESVNINSITYNSGQEFLSHHHSGLKGCILLDIRMNKMSGFELHEELIQRKNTLPIIFMTGHCDTHVAEHCKKRGAYAFIEKPFNFRLLIDLIERAHEHHQELYL